MFRSHLRARHRLQRAILFVKFGIRLVCALIDSNMRRYAAGSEAVTDLARTFMLRSRELEGFRLRHLGSVKPVRITISDGSCMTFERITLSLPLLRMSELSFQYSTNNRHLCGAIDTYAWDRGFYCIICEDHNFWSWQNVVFADHTNTATCVCCGREYIIPGMLMPSSEVESMRIVALLRSLHFDGARMRIHQLQRAILLVKFYIRFKRLWIQSNLRRYSLGGPGATSAAQHFHSLQ